MRPVAKNFRIGRKAYRGAAPVGRRADFLQRRQGAPALEGLRIELSVARHFRVQALRQRIHHRHANAVQAAGGLVGLAGEFPARVQRGHDDLQRGLVLELGVRIDRDSAPVIGHGDRAVLVHHDIDAVGVTGHGLIHRVVENFGEQVMQRAVVRAADIHARPFAHRFEAFKDLDILGGIAVFVRRFGR